MASAGCLCSSLLSAGLLGDRRCRGRRVLKLACWRVSSCGGSFQPEVLSELIAEEAGLAGAEVSVGVHQGTDVGNGELCGPQSGVHVCTLHHLLGHLQATRLGEQHSGGVKVHDENRFLIRLL